MKYNINKPRKSVKTYRTKCKCTSSEHRQLPTDQFHSTPQVGDTGVHVDVSRVDVLSPESATYTRLRRKRKEKKERKKEKKKKKKRKERKKTLSNPAKRSSTVPSLCHY